MKIAMRNLFYRLKRLAYKLLPSIPYAIVSRRTLGGLHSERHALLIRCADYENKIAMLYAEMSRRAQAERRVTVMRGRKRLEVLAVRSDYESDGLVAVIK